MLNESIDDKLDRVRRMLEPYPNDSLNMEEVMKLLGVTRKRVHVLRVKKVLPAYAVDPTTLRKDWRFKKVDLEAYLLNTK
jgi:hypothetical protein